MPRTTGYIVTYKKSRGFGFIDSPTYPEQQVFFHFREIINYETNELYSQLNQISSDNVYPPVEVSFNPVKTDRGVEAHSIQPTDVERAQETFYKIKQFLQTADFSPENIEDSFTKHVTLKIISSFGQDPSLTSIVTKKLVDSSEKWDEIVSIAQDWEVARMSLKRSAISVNQNKFMNFARHLINMLGFKPMAGATSTDVDARIPMVLQRIQSIKPPFDSLSQIENWSFVFLPDEETLADLLQTRPHFLSYGGDEMKIIILLDESRHTQFSSSNVALLSQKEIMRFLVRGDGDIVQQQGRVLRSVLPKPILQPYDAGVAYSERMFSGRTQERDRILSSRSTNFAVYGGRRIGKTWFLQDLVWKCQEPPYDKIYLPLYVSLQPARNSQQAVNYIQETINFRYGIEQYQDAYTFTLLRNRFLKLHQTHKKVILLALDEVDRLVRAKRDGQEFFEELRSFQTTYPEAIKIVFAGFKELMKSVIQLGGNNSLGNWVRENYISLGCLSKDDLRDLVLRLRWVGVTFNTDEVLDKVYDLTSGHPYYAHTLCESIATAIVNQNLKTLRPSDVDKYVSSEFFRKVFRTFRKNLNLLQRLIGKTLVDEDRELSEDEIGRLLRNKYSINISERQLSDEMSILEACSVFTHKNQSFAPVMHQINKAFFDTFNSEELALKILDGVIEEDEGEDEDADGEE